MVETQQRHWDAGEIVGSITDEGREYTWVRFPSSPVQPVSVETATLIEAGIHPIAAGVMIAATMNSGAVSEIDLHLDNFRMMDQSTPTQGTEA